MHHHLGESVVLQFFSGVFLRQHLLMIYGIILILIAISDTAINMAVSIATRTNSSVLNRRCCGCCGGGGMMLKMLWMLWREMLLMA